MNDVKKVIIEMLRENTGRHLLDSGGAYGRHWEKNQDVDFEKNEAVTHDFDENMEDTSELCLYVSVYHYLTSDECGLELDEICERFNELNTNSDNWDAECNYFGVSSEAWEYLQGFDYEEGEAWNTYNGDQTLTQVLQGGYIQIDGDRYVILQIHGGCDVRGGYTDARLFKFNQWCCEYINSCPNVYGSINGVEVDTLYNGYSLTDENGEPVKFKQDGTDKIELYLM